MDTILLRKADSNKDLKPPSNADELEEDVYKEVGDDEALRYVNKPRVVKVKGRPIGAKNKKGTISRADKAKARSTKRDSSSFKYIEAGIKALRGSSRRRGRGRGESISILGRALRQKPTVAVKEVDNTRDVHTRYTKQAAIRKATAVVIEAVITVLEEDTIAVSSDEDGGTYEDFSNSGFDIDLNIR